MHIQFENVEINVLFIFIHRYTDNSNVEYNFFKFTNHIIFTLFSSYTTDYLETYNKC